ncbi:MAG: class I mannose-6-phosphate isomerase [Kiritimatiellae bacterium]|nr:class I mannose-6-phosphate isomerase [Kiritimatiellia bacterium]
MRELKDRIYTFCPNRHEALWGAEEWLVSVHPAGPSIVASGEAKGKRLCDIVSDVPLLIKVIDAKTRLSVQVHPNEQTKLVTGGDAKTEMWCALDDGFVYAGLKPGTTAEMVENAVRDGSFEELMVRHDVKAGDVLFIPGGLVHAIGDNTRLYEVQQSSDTTFRLYDWGRVGADGKPRELHIEKGLQAIDYTLPAPQIVGGVECPFFRFRQIHLDRAVDVEGDSFTILYAFKGAFTLDGVEYPEGASVFVAAGGDFTLRGSGSTVFVVKA